MGVRRLRSSALVGLALAAALCAALIGPAVALGNGNAGGADPASAVALVLPTSGQSGSLETSATQPRDVYSVYLHSGQTLDASMTVTSAETSDTDFDMVLYKRGVTSFDDVTWTDFWAKVAMFPGPSSDSFTHEHFTFMAADTGTYYLDVHAYAGGGDYLLDAKIVPPVKFAIGSLSLPKSAKKGKKVTVSAVLTPSYNGYYAPVYFRFYRYEGGKYRLKKITEGSGMRNPGGARSKLSATYKFPKKGKWRVRAEFWDEAHASQFTKYKYITIK